MRRGLPWCRHRPDRTDARICVQTLTSARVSVAAWVALAALAGLVACSEVRNSTGPISKKIGAIVHAPGSTEVDLGKLTTFGWAYFHALQPGATREDVCKFIGASRSVCGRIVRVERAPDDHMYLLFGLNGQLTHIELHAVENGRFDLEFNEAGHPRSQSVFRIRRSSSASGKDIIVLEPR